MRVPMSLMRGCPKALTISPIASARDLMRFPVAQARPRMPLMRNLTALMRAHEALKRCHRVIAKVSVVPLTKALMKVALMKAALMILMRSHTPTARVSI